jgi:hypothetical protein
MKRYYVAVYSNLTINIIHSELDKDELRIIWNTKDIHGPYKDRVEAIGYIVDVIQKIEEDNHEN